ncbi:MAG: LytTR family DNA-binding domain-containing protein [Myxococcota bacterium]
MTLRAIVVDGEPPAREELSFLLGQCDGVEVVGRAGAPVEAERLCDEVDPHVAFIDLRMPGTDGLSLANALRRRHLELDVVIVSQHDEGAVRGFDLQISDYLLKPVSLERLRRTLRHLEDNRTDARSPFPIERFAVRRKNAYVVLNLKDVIYFEARDELVWAVTPDDRFAIDRTLASLAEHLDGEDFFQSHRGCIVRLDKIRVIEPCGARTFRIVVDHPESPVVPLARDRVGKLRERIPFLR